MKILHSFVITLALMGSMLGQDFAPTPVPKMQFLDSSGDPLSNGHVHTYITGTTTNQATYTDAGGLTANANPVVLDAGGFADIWLDNTLNYTLKVDNSANVQQYEIDGINVQFGYSLLIVGDGTAEDINIRFDGNQQNYSFGIRDSTDDVCLVLGDTQGTTTIWCADENQDLGVGGVSAGAQLDVTGNFIVDGNADEVQAIIQGNSTQTSNIFVVENSAGTDQFIVAVDSITIPADVNFEDTAWFDEVDNGNSGSADTIDWTLGNKQKSTLTDNVTYTFTAPQGPATLTLIIHQDAGGGNTATWPAAVLWPGGTAATISTGSSAIDIITCYYNGTSYFCAEVQDFS